MQELTSAVRAFPKAKADPVLNELLPKLALFQALLREHGSDVELDSAAARVAWAGLPPEAQRGALAGFSLYLENCEETVRAGVSLRDSYGLLAHSLKKANLFALEDIRGFLTNDNIAEVYNLDHIQIFRSINFFDLCNYSLLDLLAREWFVLYERLSSITDQAMREFVMALEAKQLRRLTIPVHLLKERDSNPRGVFRFDFQYCCPLFSAPGVLGGYLLTENVTELDLFAPDDESFQFLR